MGKRQEERIEIKEPKVKAPKRLTPNEIRQMIHHLFEIYGFYILDDKYLYAYMSYIDHKGSQVIACRLFMSTIEFMPYENRRELYKEIAPYLKKKFVKNPHLMASSIAEIENTMTWRPRKIEIL